MTKHKWYQIFFFFFGYYSVFYTFWSSKQRWLHTKGWLILHSWLYYIFFLQLPVLSLFIQWNVLTLSERMPHTTRAYSGKFQIAYSHWVLQRFTGSVWQAKALIQYITIDREVLGVRACTVSFNFEWCYLVVLLFICWTFKIDL